METPQGTTDTELVQPWEKETTDASVETAEQSLFDLLGSDPEFDGDEDRGEDPAENDGPLPDGIEEDDAGEGDDVEYDDDAGDEGEDEVSGEDDEDEDLADDEGDETYSVTVEGEDIEVSFDELLNGYSRTEYLTRTRQRESAAHKSAMSDVQTARSEYTEKLELMDQALGELNPSEPDWEQVQRENPGQFGALFAAHQKREKVRSAVAAEKTWPISSRCSSTQYQHGVKTRRSWRRMWAISSISLRRNSATLSKSCLGSWITGSSLLSAPRCAG